MAFPRRLNDLCTPAYVYFILSVISLFFMIVQNLGTSNRIYILGTYRLSVVNKILIFLVKVIYILFWTWILNLMCKDGHKDIAWFLVILPFIMGFLLVASTMGNNVMPYEGLTNKNDNKKKPVMPMPTMNM